MKQKIIIAAFILLASITMHAQAQDPVAKNKSYTGARATGNTYHVIYQLDSGSPEIIKKAIRNIKNLLNDPRLEGKLEVELVAFSDGTEAFRKESEYEQGIKDLLDQGVLIVQCMNTLKERKIDKSELYDFLAYTPSGNGELVIRAAQGWAIVKP
ncbi:DsrE family protein [Sphingobacterium sp. JB170]|uniref:DsrE family protein n=1 Tax=Sphingobacterium sp. JB170 TaxID=1434842 RepID=UPI00097E76A0|nr:DsrE family protein [Sphingobacterium sp. JB170]SJN47413.1 Blr3520 protein homolog, hypothetical protein [Sphingobacterium sp. JB170]